MVSPLQWRLRMSRRNEVSARMAIVAGAAAAIAITATPASARAQAAAALVASDFDLVLSRIDSSSGAFTALGDDAREGFFSAARCACATSYGVTLALTSAGAAKLAAGDSLDATVMIGSDCDNVSAAACPSFGSSLTLDAGTTSTRQTLPTSDVFGALAPGASCGALPSTSSRLWAIVRLNGTRIDSQPSVTMNLGGAAPLPPKAVTAQTADSGLLVSWTPPATTAGLQGYQVLCSPAASSPPAAAFDTCAGALPTGGTGPFASLDAAVICSELVGTGTHSVRVHGLHNGSVTQVAVVSIGDDGTASAPSELTEATPGPTLGFHEIYEDAGGTGMEGCAISEGVGGGDARWLVTIVVGIVIVSSLHGRRRRRLLVAVALLIGASRAEARAGDDDDFDGPRPTLAGVSLGEARVPLADSPRRWNLELRFGPYYPNVDSELADRGLPARPFEQVFSSKKRLMSGIELDRQISHRGGTWAVGIGAGYYKATAAALAADGVTRTGDETSLSIIPLSLLAIYRADLLRSQLGSPLVPYAKLGLGCALWSASDTSAAVSTSGATLGWSAAAGVTLDLAILDPESARTMDIETGINQFAVFFEVSRAALDGFGSSSVLRVGDTTWLGGLMLEM